MERALGKIRNEKCFCSTTAALRAPRRPRQFFPKSTSIDLEAQKNLEQKKSFHLGDQFTQTRRPTLKNGANSTENFSKKYFLEKSMKILKNQKFWFFEIFIEFSKKVFSKIFRSNFPHFAWSVAVFEWIDLQAGMIFLLQVFLYFEIYTSSLRKKLSRATRGAQRGCGWAGFFFVRNFPEGTFHLPGERDLFCYSIFFIESCDIRKISLCRYFLC